MYLAVAYLPLTVFLAIVVAFRISVASPHLNAAVFLCQLYASPAVLRVLVLKMQNTWYAIIIQLFSTLYGIWNLDFFRTVVPPICLPLNTLQVIALDYLVAVYPLFLLVCFYLLVTAHDRGCKLVVRLARLFFWCSARLRHQWNIKHSIIDAFTSFLLLSHIKFVSTSANLLIPTELRNIHGSSVGYFIYYDATVEFMGSQHMAFAILALVMLVAAATFPLLLLLYPMKWFQSALNKCHLNSPVLRTFMDCFQGYYRDRTEGGRDCRYFAALYPSLRIVGLILYAVTRSDFFLMMIVLMQTVVIVILVLVSPYKKQYSSYNTLDILLVVSSH
jgi:hypothetical protein